MAGEPSIGIDLGTTNSAVATFADGKLRLIERATGQRLMPSMVGITPDGDRVVGEEARLLSETRPENVAFATKRFIGARWSAELAASARQTLPFPLVAGPQQDVRVKLGERVLPVVEISSAVLAELCSDAEAHFDREVRRAVITVPANFDDAQRQATQEAAAIAGLEVLRLVNEPTAAALAFGLSTGFSGKVVVFDLGGGTFDVSILDVAEGVFEVVATGGDQKLGGEDFDGAVVQWLLERLHDPGHRRRVQDDRQALTRLKIAAEEAKKVVSTTERARVSTVLLPDRPGRSIALDTVLTREVLEGLVKPKAQHCLAVAEETMGRAGVMPGKATVLLVGGMTRMPLIRRMVAERIGALAPLEVNPDEAVAFGAAIHAAELVQKTQKTLLMDVVGSTLSVGIAGGLVKRLVPKNTRLPFTATEIFYPGRDGQRAARIPVYQGESPRSKENALLGQVRLEGLTQATRSLSAIEVQFAVGVDGMLQVSAKDVATGHIETAGISARTELTVDERSRLERLQAELKAARESTPRDERERNRLARRALHELVVMLRRVHRDLKLAASEVQDRSGLELAERVGERLVAAERAERTGSREEVVELAWELRELVGKVSGYQAPEPVAAKGEDVVPAAAPVVALEVVLPTPSVDAPPAPPAPVAPVAPTAEAKSPFELEVGPPVPDLGVDPVTAPTAISPELLARAAAAAGSDPVTVPTVVSADLLAKATEPPPVEPVTVPTVATVELAATMRALSMPEPGELTVPMPVPAGPLGDDEPTRLVPLVPMPGAPEVSRPPVAELDEEPTRLSPVPHAVLEATRQPDWGSLMPADAEPTQVTVAVPLGANDDEPTQAGQPAQVKLPS